MTIATKVSKTFDNDKDISYKIDCDCGDHEHNVEMFLDCDNDNIVELTFYVEGKVTAYCSDNIFYRAYVRVKKALTILIFGEFTMSSEIIITKEEHVDGIIEAFAEIKKRFTKYKGEK